MSTITKKDLIDRVSQRTALKRTEVREAIQCFLDEISSTLGEGDRIEFRDFGVFEVRERKERKAQNPRTLEPVMVPAKRTVKFKAGRLMQQAVDGAETRVQEPAGHV